MKNPDSDDHNKNLKRALEAAKYLEKKNDNINLKNIKRININNVNSSVSILNGYNTNSQKIKSILLLNLLYSINRQENDNQ